MCNCIIYEKTKINTPTGDNLFLLLGIFWLFYCCENTKITLVQRQIIFAEKEKMFIILYWWIEKYEAAAMILPFSFSFLCYLLDIRGMSGWSVPMFGGGLVLLLYVSVGVELWSWMLIWNRIATFLSYLYLNTSI
jgi:hypothetical protein